MAEKKTVYVCSTCKDIVRDGFIVHGCVKKISKHDEIEKAILGSFAFFESQEVMGAWAYCTRCWSIRLGTDEIGVR